MRNRIYTDGNVYGGISLKAKYQAHSVEMIEI